MSTDYLDEVFSSTYEEARLKFRDAVAEHGGRLFAYNHPGADNGESKPLSVDVGVIGREDAPNVALIISGTHGLEGFAGGAAQLSLLKSLKEDRSVPENVRLVLVHGINPWGWSNLSRTTEENIDLNRNFMAFNGDNSTPELYSVLREIMQIDPPTQAYLETVWPQVGEMIQKYGPNQVSDTMAAGQYSYDQDMNYGGTEPCWSNRTMRQIVKEHVLPASHVGLIDWHSGIGEWAEPFFLCFHPEGTDAYKRAADWWGAENIKTQDVSEDMPQPNYRGLLFHGVAQELTGIDMTGTVIEFGTYPLPEMGNALIIDQWLKFGKERDDANREGWRAYMVERFYPASSEWRNRVIEISLDVQRKMVFGLSES